MKTVKASLLLILIAVVLSACSSQWDKQAFDRSWNIEGVKNIRSIDWTVFQQALQRRYVNEAKSAQDNSNWDEIKTFNMRGYQASYGGYLLPEEINDRELPAKEIPVMTEARDWLMSAFDRRARVHAALPAAQAQVYFDCWMYKVEDPSQAADIERCRQGFLKAMDKIEDILAALEEKPMMAEPKASGEVIVKSGSVTVGDKELENECYRAAMNDKGVKIEGGTNQDGDCDMGDKYAGAKAALPPAPKTHVVYFDTDLSNPQDASAATLPEMARQLIEDIRSRQHSEVVIEGHADRQGNGKYNMGLSQRRAEAVRDLLSQEGLQAADMQVEWLGETKPAVDTPDGQSEQQNRRVEVYVR